MKTVLEIIEAIKTGLMLMGIIVLIGCGILIISGMIDVALKGAMMYVGLYIVIASVSCIIETIIKANQNTEEDDEE